LKENLAGQKIWVRARLATSRAVGKGVFILLRQQTYSVQGVLWQGEKVSKGMVKYAGSIPLESIVDIEGTVVHEANPIQSATQKHVELHINEIHVVSRAQDLPFLVEDAGRNEAEAAAAGLPTVLQDTSLNFRWVDTRTPANQAIFRIQSGVCGLFREFLDSRGFVEIHTPKLIGGASEGGANVFKLEYFGQPACLAQSPQFYKQMTAACGGFERVYEIGPVFRAEDSNTHRHLCEFTGLDFEMAIYEHYYEALEVMGELFNFIFDGIYERFSHELMLIGQQYPFEPIEYLRPPLRITFQEGISLLREAGIDASYEEDISTPHEKALGKIVKEKYKTDFYIMDKYPLSVRPFYTMPDPSDPKLSNSYDLFIRGEEIVSGAQRVHDVDLLIERANQFNIPIKSIQSYIDAFKHGALPHAGGGIGLERVVMLFLGLKNIRKTSMFPRDPSRLSP
jgi:aspartyl-tRNA synthetase